MKQGEVRIIGGQWRGRKLRFPVVSGLRPTTDQIRETVFNWLAPYIQGAHCLDLFAGTGALGFEALSRGAASVTFVDQNPEITNYLKNQVTLLDAKNTEILCLKIPSTELLRKTNFNLIFLDPPFHQDLIAPTCQWLEQFELPAETLIYIESEADLNPIPLPANWEVLRNKVTGQVRYCLLKIGEEEETSTLPSK